MIIDSHCHLYDLDLQVGVAAVVERAAAAGVGYMLNVAVDLESFPQVLAAAERYRCIYASVGVHPNTELAEDVIPETLCALGNHPRVVAIGETGLDYYRAEGDVEWQRRRFKAHIAAAREIGKPLIIHTRESGSDVIRLLEDEHARDVGGVMHCFVDDWDMAQRAMDLNFYISFSGIVTFKNAHQVQDVARRVPLERLLVETDSPYLAPVPHRGKTNEPAFVRHVVDYIAELRQVEVKTLAATSSVNFFRLFETARPEPPALAHG